ncbi:MAG: shikimate dehydrogenase [Spirochaetales bacterium]|nr:MAG: shikimate dehydrogenase [Spirochaetales bacterium]
MEERNYTPASEPTIYFFGVTTAASSIMKVFPKWAEELGIKAVIRGVDFNLHDAPEEYRKAVLFIKGDPLSMGALVTAHKIDLYKASSDLFDSLDPFAELIHETSCLVSAAGTLKGFAKDPVSSGLSMESLVGEGYWRKHGGELCILGAGGSGTALTLYTLMTRDKKDLPSRIIVTNRSIPRLDELRRMVGGLEPSVPVDFVPAPEPAYNDAVVSALKPYSMVCNATGLGKDRPGSPITEAAVFPENGIAWDFNYRGELLFLDQARRQKAEKRLRVEDGWTYFVHGWTRALAEIFSVYIPVCGKAFDRLSEIAARYR